MVNLELLLVGLLQEQTVSPSLKQLFIPQDVAFDSSAPLSAPIIPITPVYQLETHLDDEFQRQNLDVKEFDSAQDDEDEDDEDDSLSRPRRQTSPYVFLEGEVIFGISSVSGRELEDSVVFQGSAEFIFNVSFTGEDILAIGLEGGIAEDFSFIEDITFEGQLDSPSDTDEGQFELGDLYYEFPVGDRASFYISTTGDDIEEFNPFLGDALSEFGTENPISGLLGDFGFQFNYEIADPLELTLGYFSEDGGDPDAGLFRGNYSAFAQLGFEPSDCFLLGLTYIYTNNDSSLETETGSVRSQLDLGRPLIGNSFGAAVSFSPSDRVAIGGWAGLTNARVLGLGDADVWNYALTLAFPDFLNEGNLLGLIIGQEPRLTGTSGFTIDDRRRDPDVSLHLELFYTNRISDQISITPGVIWITAPNHDRSNPDIVLFTVRTTFEF